jgi:hypothetical protein
MKSLGLLSSLVFVREIKDNAAKYISDVELAAVTFLKELRHLDVVIENKTPFCHLIKSHSLIHLGDNIRRFGCALHYETERGEQLNKFIREHIHHTNGHNPTRDIAITFGRESMLRHILDGGYWKDKDGCLGSVGPKAKKWIEDNSAKFYARLLGGSRIPQDNNYILQPMKEGMCGVFSIKASSSTTKPMFIGMAKKQGDSLLLDVYEVHELSHERQVVVTTKTARTIPLSDAITEAIIDMHMTDQDGQRLVNVCKFSSYWFLSENISKIQ